MLETLVFVLGYVTENCTSVEGFSVPMSFLPKMVLVRKWFAVLSCFRFLEDMRVVLGVLGALGVLGRKYEDSKDCS